MYTDTEPGLQEPTSAPKTPSKSSLESEDSFYTSLESYPWTTDAEFQSGLIAILGPSYGTNSSSSQIEDLTLRARCFYYDRKFQVPVDFEKYKRWRLNQPKDKLTSLSPRKGLDSDSLDDSRDGTPTKPKSRADMSTSGDEGRAGSLTFEAPKLFEDPTPPGSMNITPTKSGDHGARDESQDNIRQESLQPSYPSSFREVMELIKSGKPIPGIKEIPDTVLVGQASEAKKSVPQKPWEVKPQGASSNHISSHNMPSWQSETG